MPSSRKAPFRLFNHLMEHPNFIFILLSSWNIPCNFKGLGGVWYKLKHVKKNLETLHFSASSKVANKVEQWRALLFDAQSYVLAGNSSSLVIENNITAEFRKWLAVENSILAQKSRIKWLKDFDDCTKFFHTATKEQKSSKRIASLIDPHGNTLNSDADIEREILKFYKDLMGSASLDH